MKRVLSVIAIIMGLMVVAGVAICVFLGETRPGNASYSPIETDVPIRAGGWVDALFDWCVRLLLQVADVLALPWPCWQHCPTAH